MRLNKSIERYIMNNDRSRFLLQLLGGVCWLCGAGLSAVWMLHGGGAIRPLACFAVWATGLCFVMVRALARTSDLAPTLREMSAAIRYGGYSVVLLALATLFCEFWPVTVSMAFMFAVCRSFKDSDDTPAYV
jgi:hypothetical protein